jgi:7-carboxy-7-deazaguanine synthase
MFGQNIIVGKSFFRDVDDKLLVTSRFLTLQGEGPFQGQPALFIRLAFCNTNCSFCDTFFDQGDWFTIQDLLIQSQIMIQDKYGEDWRKCGIVITGGEPSLQSNIVEFLARCKVAQLAFLQIESNGIIPLELPYGITLVVSPKCSEKTFKYLTPNEHTLNRADCLKFIVSVDETSPYHTIPDWAFAWQQETNKPIYISPMNMYRAEFLQMARQRVQERKQHNIDFRSTVDEVISGWDDTILDREKNMKNHMYAFKYAADNGLFLTLQMHLFGVAA